MTERKIKPTALIVGTRPNFMKAIPIWKELQKQSISKDIHLVHTRQHYSKNLSDIFLQQLGVSKEEIEYLPNFPKTSSHEIFSWIFVGLTEYFKEHNIKKAVVFGDVNSTLAAALAASFLNIPIIHIEAGLRSRNPKMPEERNRVLVDHMSSFLTTTEPSAVENLRREGMVGKVITNGNTMMDTLVSFLPFSRNLNMYRKHELENKKYILLTLHRQENVDDQQRCTHIINALNAVKSMTDLPIVFPIHPRTSNLIKKFKLNISKWKVIPPVGYTEMLSLLDSCGILITDSGGLQEESSYLGVPCITIRTETERPVTVTEGSNVIIQPTSIDLARRLIDDIQLRIGTRKSNIKRIRGIMGNGIAAKKIAERILAI